MKITIDIKYLIILTISFVLFTIIGTVSHEFGHIIVAKSLGYETTLHYGSMHFENSVLSKDLKKIYLENKTEIMNVTDFNRKNEYEKKLLKSKYNGLLITVGGPLQTILTGIIGVLILFFRQRKINEYKLKLIDWFAIFLSLFWLREVFILTTSIIGEIISPNGSYFGGDEKNISDKLNFWEGTVSTILGTIGISICIFIIFKIIPKRLRLTFILSGLIGGIFGFILWMNILGPKILP